MHEAYLRLVDRGGTGADWQDRSHFFAVAARVMRSVLVDHARARRTAKRGGGAHALTLDAAAAEAAVAERSSNPGIDVELLDEALTRVAAPDPRQARMVELGYFGGLSIGEAAEALGVLHATVEREWKTARLWLRRELEGGGGVG